MKKYWQEAGEEPDYRFSLANERTFLAWIRTTLGILAGAALFRQFAHSLQPQWLVPVLCSGLSLTAAVLGAVAYTRWRNNEVAMRHRNALPRSSLLAVLSVITCLLAIAVALLLGQH